jgi:hypothetical protein
VLEILIGMFVGGLLLVGGMVGVPRHCL